MLNIESICEKISNNIAQELNLDYDKKSVINILRKRSGGGHASSPRSCAILGTIVSVGMALISKHIDVNLIFIILVGNVIFIWSYYIVY